MTFTFVVTLGLLLAVVHSTPVTTVTQIPAIEDEVIRTALKDGFLVEHSSIPFLMTKSPKRNTTAQASQLPSPVSVMEGSGEESTTLQSVTHTSTEHPTLEYTSPQSSFITISVPSEVQSSSTTDHTSASTTRDPAVTRSDFLTTQSTTKGGDLHQSSTTTSSTTHHSNTDTLTSTAAFPKLPEVFASSHASGSGEESGSGMEPTTVSTTTEETKKMSESPTASDGGSGSGSGEGSGMTITPVSTTTEETKKMSESPTASDGGSGSGSGEGSGTTITPESTKTVLRAAVPKGRSIVNIIQELAPTPQGNKLVPPPEPQNKGHSTPGWIIIVGFIVGVAALVLLCLAIATRDKWNGPRPSKACQQETKTNSSNQQRELEMETFLHNDKPKENGKAAEYTVIPLEELPEKHSSH